VADLLLEIGCEELPGAACRELIAQVPKLARAALAEERLEAADVSVAVSPRRFALRVDGLPDERPGRSRSVRGPAEAAAFADGEPTKAASGFARSQGIAVEQLAVREQDGRTFVFADVEEPAAPTAELVPRLAAAVVDGIRFGKTMRWGDGSGLRFSRPVRWIVAKLGERTVEFELHGLRAGDVSQGHRFLGRPATIADAAGYRDALLAVGVVADHDERRREIIGGLDAAAAAAAGRWHDPGGALEEVIFLVERPSVITGGIDPAHLRLPRRVLVTAMQSHQRYFPLEDAEGGLMPAFLAVSNGDPAHAALITKGNEEVLDARLQDAAFSFDVDRDAGLEALDARLPNIVFHARLGSMADKRDRLVGTVAALAEAVGVDASAVAAAAEAARLAKADQGAVLVAEFSELEGEVAAEYARLEGHSEEVCRAVAQHYLPEGPGSPLPEGDAAALLAAADKVDNLVGAFLVDEAPTGSKDPYGQRRAAAGLVRILLERGWDVSLRELLAGSAARLRAQGADLAVDDDAALDTLETFVAERLARHLAEEGVTAEAAAAAQGAGLDSLVATAAWARGVQEAAERPELASAWTAGTRLARIAARAEDGVGQFASVGDPGEDALAAAVEAAAPIIERARADRDFAAALTAAAGVAGPVDRFFDEVMVNADDPVDRARRLALVSQASAVLRRAVDLGAVTEGGGVL